MSQLEWLMCTLGTACWFKAGVEFVHCATSAQLLDNRAMEVDLESSDDETEYGSASDDDLGSIPMCIRHPGWTNVILVVSYGMFGIMYLTAKQGWHAETALYVVVQIITTIGFGDITVTKEEEAHVTVVCGI
eukprot:s4231_g9.t1